MVKNFVIKIVYDYKEDIMAEQLIDYDNKVVLHTAKNFEDLSEAVIGNNIFDCFDYIDAIKLGMELHKKGYEDISVETKDLKRYF